MLPLSDVIIGDSAVQLVLTHQRGQVRVCSDAQVANRNSRVFGWEIAHAAVSQRPPLSLTKIVARTEGYTNAASVRDWSIVQRPFSVAPCHSHR
jgi:hypothetical protein